MKCGKKNCPGKSKCSKCSHGKGKKRTTIPTPKAKKSMQRGAVRKPTQKRRAY